MSKPSIDIRRFELKNTSTIQAAATEASRQIVGMCRVSGVLRIPCLTVLADVPAEHPTACRDFLTRLEAGVYTSAATLSYLPPATLLVEGQAGQSWFRVPYLVPAYALRGASVRNMVITDGPVDTLLRVLIAGWGEVIPDYEAIIQLPQALDARETAVMAMVVSGLTYTDAVRTISNSFSKARGSVTGGFAWSSSAMLTILNHQERAPRIMRKFPADHPLHARVVAALAPTRDAPNATPIVEVAQGPVAVSDAELLESFSGNLRHTLCTHAATAPATWNMRSTAWKALFIMTHYATAVNASSVVHSRLLLQFQGLVESLSDDAARAIVSPKGLSETLHQLLDALVTRVAQQRGVEGPLAEAQNFRNNPNKYRATLLQWLIG